VSARVVAIDGAAGSGKSTLARRLAEALGLPYINTGTMYRAVAAAALASGVDPEDATRLKDLGRGLRFTLRGDPPALEVEGWPSQELTTPAVERAVSAVARHPAVREILRREQRRLGAEGGVVEGRDIGGVVFPEAPVKLFLRADPGARTARRAAERLVAPEIARATVGERDERDARTNPLEPVAGAIVIDTGTLDVDATFEAAMRVIREYAPELIP